MPAESFALAASLAGPFTAIARAMSGQWGVNVIPNGFRCMTDGKNIWIPFAADHLGEEARRALHGMLDHEVCHVVEEEAHEKAGRAGYFAVAKTAKNKTVRMLLNVVEDIRIEKKWSVQYPGVAQNLLECHRHVLALNARDWAKAKRSFWDAFGLVFFAAARGLEGDTAFVGEKALTALRECEAELKAAETLEWIQDSYDLAERIYNKLNRDAEETMERAKKPKKKPAEKPEPKKDEGKSEDGEKSDEGEPSPGDEGEGEPTEGDEDGETGGGGSEDDEELDDDADDEDLDDDGDSDGDADDSDDDESDDGADDDAADEDEEPASEPKPKPKKKPEPEPESETDDDAEDGADGEEADEDLDDEDEGEDGTGGAGDEPEDGADSEGSASRGDEDEEGEESEPTAEEVERAREILETVAGIDDFVRALADELEKKAREDAREHKLYIPDPALKKLDRWFKPVGGDLSNYMSAKADVDQQIGAIRAKQLAYIQTITRKKTITGQDSGMLDAAALATVRTGAMDVFADIQKGIALDTAIEVLLDLSGSMGLGDEPRCAAYYCKRIAIALAEAWEPLRIPNEFIGFSNEHSRSLEALDPDCVRRAPFDFYVFKAWGERLKACRERFTHIRGYWDNADGEAVLAAAQRLALRKEKRKMLVVISDGMPCHSGIGDHVLNKHLKETVRRITRSGMEVLGVGAGTTAPANFYNASTGAKNLIIKDLNTMAPSLFKTLRESILK